MRKQKQKRVPSQAKAILSQVREYSRGGKPAIYRDAEKQKVFMRTSQGVTDNVGQARQFKTNFNHSFIENAAKTH